MKWTMIIGGLASFAFAFWVAATSLGSDIQILMVQTGAVGGFIMFGIAGVLHDLERKAR